MHAYYIEIRGEENCTPKGFGADSVRSFAVRVADDRNAAELGHRLFFDPFLSRNDRVSCATCHVPELLFTDGRATSRGVADTSRNAPTLVGASHSPWMYWDGRRDSL